MNFTCRLRRKKRHKVKLAARWPSEEKKADVRIILVQTVSEFITRRGMKMKLGGKKAYL